LFLLDLFKSAKKPHAFWAEIETATPGDRGFDKTISANNLRTSIAIISLLHLNFTIRACHHKFSGRRKRQKYKAILLRRRFRMLRALRKARATRRALEFYKGFGEGAWVSPAGKGLFRITLTLFI
jgi:hypothetical protein